MLKKTKVFTFVIFASSLLLTSACSTSPVAASAANTVPNVRLPDERYARENMKAAERLSQAAERASQDAAVKADIRQRYQQRKPKMLAEEGSTRRLEACDSFGFERGTDAHAECAMKLFMNEQNQGTANAVTSSNNQQTAALARQQAIQEATIKEQKRIQELKASLRMMQFGVDLMNGTTSSPTPSKTHSQTYNINGQIIRCTTTGSITTCL